MNGNYTTWFEGANSDSAYFSQYENAIKILLKECVEKTNIDSLILPTLFLIRHCLELGLKHNIRFFSEYSQKEDYLNKLNDLHNLKKLLKAFHIHVMSTMDKFGYERKNNTRCAMEVQIKKATEVIEFLDKLDESGTSFRYAKNKNGDRSLKKSDNFDLRIIEERFGECLKLFRHTQDILSDGITYYDEMEKEMESHISSLSS